MTYNLVSFSMNNSSLIHIVRFVGLILLQGFVLINASLFNGLAIPFVYVFFILLLPVDTNRILLLIICVITGLFVDLFYNSLGIHASAALFLGYIRPGILKTLQPREGYDQSGDISIQNMGLNWFVVYAGLLILSHHLWLFIFDDFNFSYLPKTLLKVLLSSIYTFTLVLFIHLIFSKSK